ncbi:tyrosine--tRNA ligase [Rickettsia endosymbiont of Cardiosporidium cionae]|uniref:tyrosine--tRNA ligase n=1 Tax=Rickettsia endosymbiont of Cardiosporidium cionae TaxID=2777155 RepID=UPI0018948642|nr:tyrosine--tRNA ligase [Rickettsia endosymbiont of Cardiosporidium cionae]KAF8818463.1 tyrosine--tRNA ligase [Rickettsia endosymbiont of Cardiosporidium cionae]
MECFEYIKNKGYIYQSTEQKILRERLNKNKITFYVGFDCTAPSLHIGNLMQIMLVRALQKYGHTPIILIGEATTKIGDPTGKTETRKMLNDQEIEQNIVGIKHSLSKFIDFEDKNNKAIIVSNKYWLDSIKYLDFLREFGRVISINRMLNTDYVQSRLNNTQALTFLEFNYMILQAYDFYYLNKIYNCELQIGGSDQWGNIIAGIELIKKTYKNTAQALTTPLVTNAAGQKMGKSINGAIWLNKNMCTPYDYYQYWRNIDDNDAMKFAQFYCEFSDSEIEEIKNIAINNINLVKQKIAYQATKLCHGKDLADKALKTSINIFEKKLMDDDLPTIKLEKKIICDGIVIHKLIKAIGYTISSNESRKLIRSKAIKINNKIITDETYIINNCNLQDGKIEVSCGKKKKLLVKVE